MMNHVYDLSPILSFDQTAIVTSNHFVNQPTSSAAVLSSASAPTSFLLMFVLQQKMKFTVYIIFDTFSY